jgi:predicted DNA-binding ribbon-helix-helix protein
MRVDNSAGKGTSGMDKFSSKVHRVHMELGGRLLTSLRIETQFFEKLQSVGVVDGAAHTQKDDVESNRGSLENVAKVFVLFLCGVQLVMRSVVFTVLDLNEVDVTPRFAGVFRLVLSGVGGSTGGWRCC